MLLAIVHFSRVLRPSVVQYKDLSVRFIILKLPFDDSAIVKGFLALSMLKIVFELSIVDTSIEFELAHAIFFAVDECALVYIAVGIDVFALALYFSILEVALKVRAVLHLEDAVPVLDIVEPLAMVLVVGVGVSVNPITMSQFSHRVNVADIPVLFVSVFWRLLHNYKLHRLNEELNILHLIYVTSCQCQDLLKIKHLQQQENRYRIPSSEN